MINKTKELSKMNSLIFRMFWDRFIKRIQKENLWYSWNTWIDCLWRQYHIYLIYRSSSLYETVG